MHMTESIRDQLSLQWLAGVEPEIAYTTIPVHIQCTIAGVRSLFAYWDHNAQNIQLELPQ